MNPELISQSMISSGRARQLIALPGFHLGPHALNKGMAVHDLFLSCVSNEFHKDAGHGFESYRDQLEDRLHKAGFHVEVQEKFTEHGGDLLQKLEDYIEDCRAVVHLVGDMTGDAAKPDEVHALLQRTRDFMKGRPDLRTALGDFSGISYTQWEALLALHYQRPLFRYQAEDSAPRSPRYLAEAAQKAAQRAHWDRLKDSGIFPGSFKDLRDLCLQVFEALHREHILSDTTARPHHLIHNLPQSSIRSLFKGRDEFMKRLRSTLTDGGKQAAVIMQRPAVIRALGGVGKTRMAIEYGWHFAEEYDALLFVSAATPALLKDNIAGLTGPTLLNLQDQFGSDAEKQYHAALKWLQDHKRWFLILDNVDTEESLNAVTEILTRLTHGHVCITTQLSTWPLSVQTLPLEVLTDEAGAVYLLEATHGQRAATGDDEPQARALSQRLDGLALALEHAAAYIRKLHLSFRDYLTKLETNAAAIHQWHDKNTVQYPKSVAETWLITFEKLSPDERELLNILSWLDPAPIPVWLVGKVEGASRPSPSADDKGRDAPSTLEPRELLAGLAQWHFITWSDDAQTFKVHRLVQEVTRLRLGSEAECKSWLNMALEWIIDADLGEPQDPFTWVRWIPAAPHALRLAEHAEEQQQWEPAVRWRSDVGLLQQSRARFADAELLYRSALALAELHLSPRHDDLAAVLNNLASLLYTASRLNEAEPLCRRALAIDEKNYGPNHPRVAIRLNNLAELLHATNRQTEAEPVYRRALAIDEKSYGPDHPNVAIRLNNLAALLYATNRVDEAVPIFRRVVSIFEKSYGPDHPNVATAVNNLAVLLDNSGLKNEAESLYRRALAIDEKSYGPDHPNVAIRLNNLAGLLRATKRMAEAEPMYRREVSILEKSYGLDHPEVATAVNNLAGLLHATKRLTEAEQMFRRVISIFEKSYGPDHPEVAVAVNNLALFLRATNRLAEAEPLVRRALAIDEKSYGPTHPNVAIRLNNLALLLDNSDRKVEAEPMYRRAWAIDEQIFGPEHPEVALDLMNLASVLHELNRNREALPLIHRAVAVYQRSGQTRGCEHPDLANAQAWLKAIRPAATWRRWVPW